MSRRVLVGRTVFAALLVAALASAGEKGTSPSKEPAGKPVSEAPAQKAPERIEDPKAEKSAQPDSGIVHPFGVSTAPAPPNPLGPHESPVPKDPEPEAILLVSGHTAGWVTPCGCPGVRAGGVARRAGYGDLLRTTYPGLDVRYLDQGGFIDLRSDTNRIITGAVLEAMNAIGYDSANAGVADLGMTLDQSDYVRTHINFPRFSANMAFQDTGELVFPPYRILTMRRRGGPEAPPIRVGILGLVSDQRSLFAFGPDGRSVIALPVDGALRKYVPELRPKVDFLLVLAETSPDPFYGLLKQVPGIDQVVCGQSQEVLVEPIRVNGIPISAVGTQGKYLAEIRIVSEGGKLKSQPFVHWLDTRFPENPALKQSTETVLDAVNESSRIEVFKDTAPPPATVPFVGVETCTSCHAKEVEVWRGSKHAGAFKTLIDNNRDYTTTCVFCHVTGMNAPEGGGFANPRATPQMMNVQCEACHGPMEEHVKDPTVLPEKVPEDKCIACHSLEQDPHFDRAVRWAKIAH